MAKDVINLSRLVKERDEKVYAEDSKYVFDLMLFVFIIHRNRNQALLKDNAVLKQRLEGAEKKLVELQRVNEVRDLWREFHRFILVFVFKTIHDEWQALQLICTQLEIRNQDLDAINIAIRRELTSKVEGKCQELDEEVRNHEEFVTFERSIFIQK